MIQQAFKEHLFVSALKIKSFDHKSKDFNIILLRHCYFAQFGPLNQIESIESMQTVFFFFV